MGLAFGRYPTAFGDRQCVAGPFAGAEAADQVAVGVGDVEAAEADAVAVDSEELSQPAAASQDVRCRPVAADRLGHRSRRRARRLAGALRSSARGRASGWGDEKLRLTRLDSPRGTVVRI